MGVYRTPDERFENLPGYNFAPHYFEFDGLRMHYVDEGQGDPVLLLHGEPTWSYLYRKMIPPLAAKYRVIAPDYIGFGKSDKWTEVEDYTFARHEHNLERLIEKLDLRNMTIVVQDWGGPIGLVYAANHPDRVARLVILNTGLFSGEGVQGPGLQSWREYVARTPDLPIGKTLARAIKPRGGIPEEVEAAYDAPFPVPESKAGAKAFPAIIPTSPDEPGAAEMLHAKQVLEKWNKSALVMFSDQDPIFSVETGRRIQALIPGAQFSVIEGAGHFLQEEKGEVIAERMLEFMK